MRELLPDLDHWLQAGQSVALATVVNTWGSSPRPVGSKMALSADGNIIGSVSGGCVEGAVFEAGVQTLASGRAQLLHFGVADETAWNVGLACGGQIDVFVQVLENGLYDGLQHHLRAGRPVGIATVIRGSQDLIGRTMVIGAGVGQVGEIAPGIDDALIAKALPAIAAGKTQSIWFETESQGAAEIFLEVIEPPPALIIVGGVHAAIPLTVFAHTLGYSTVVIDPRKAFGNRERFPNVDRLIQQWPDEAFVQLEITQNTAVAMLTHDPKIDDPALMIALQSPAFYIGALGSQTTQAKRRQRLLESGLNEAQISRLHGPIGLKLGGRSPEEIAMAIMAEIIAVKYSGAEPEGSEHLKPTEKQIQAHSG